VQLIANAHFGASVRNFVMSENRIPQGDLYEELGEEPLTVKDGNLKVPDRPGLGINARPEVMNRIIENGPWR
jgi:L-alanine-DL-glutamate epimerase-like enolase superfamily enzyme